MELNSKAETKFKKLRAQAKVKIAELTRQMEQLKGSASPSGNDTLNVSSLNTSSLDESVASSSPTPTQAGTADTDHAHKEAESLRAQLAEREQEVTRLKEEVCRWEQEGGELRTVVGTLKNKLSVAEVCLHKEQETRVSMELQIASVEERLDQVTSELSQTRDENTKLAEELDRRKNQSKDLDEGLYPTESEGYRTEQAHGEMTDSPSVLAAGERGSLVDLESEISRLEATIRERDQQLSSFKTVLEEKESSIEGQRQREAELTTELQRAKQETDSVRASKDCEIERLTSELSTSNQSALDAKQEVEYLRGSVSELETDAKKLKEALGEKDTRLDEISTELCDLKATREKLEQDLTLKCEEVRNLAEEARKRERELAEKDAKISDGVSCASALEQTVKELQLTNESLRANMDSSREETVGKVAEYSGKIASLEHSVSELRNELEAGQLEKKRLMSTVQQLEEQLSVVREDRQQGEVSSGKEMEELRVSLGRQLEEREVKVQELEKKLTQQDGELRALATERDGFRDKMTENQELLAKEKQASEDLKSQKEAIAVKLSETQSQVTKMSGALEFAQEELVGRDGTIKNLSGALEEKRVALAALESNLTRLKLEQANKLTEMMQHSEQSVQAKGVIEIELRDAKTQLETKERDLKALQSELEAAIKARDGFKTDLEVATSKFDALQREKESSKLESETLRGQVESLSEARSSLSQEKLKQEESLTELRSKLSQTSSQHQALQKRLDVTSKKLQKAVEERERLEEDLDRQQKESQQGLEKMAALRDEERRKREEIQDSLARHQKTNQQMKEQFDSAVKLMESKLSSQTTAMGRVNIELNQKDSELTSLRDQLAGESRANAELKRLNTKLTDDCKSLTERANLLASERSSIEQTLSTLTSQHSHLEHSYSDALSEREMLQLENKTSLERVQEHEARVLDLTDQLGKLAREKQTLEGQLHEVSRQLLSSEQSKLGLMGEVGRLKEAVQGAGDWDQERKAVLESKASLEGEKAALLDEGVKLRAQLTQLEREKTVLQAEAVGLRGELSSLHEQSQSVTDSPSSSQNEDLRKQMAELQQSHTSELTRVRHAHSTELSSVQRALEEERSKREVAESSLAAQREVAISMEDVQPFVSGGTGGEARPANFVDYMNVASAWIQRLVKNPNIVLTRLLRATHQTKLFFLFYFLFLHLLLLYLIVT